AGRKRYQFAGRRSTPAPGALLAPTARQPRWPAPPGAHRQGCNTSSYRGTLESSSGALAQKRAGRTLSMKKDSRKPLNLSRETLVALTDNQTKIAAAGELTTSKVLAC